MLDFPIVDSHLHIWNLQELRYAWLDDLPLLNRNMLTADFDAARGKWMVDKIVFMQAECAHAQYRKEVEFVTREAQKDGRIRAIVAWAPLETAGENEEALRYLQKNPLVKGVRRLIQTEDAAVFCRNEAFVYGVRMLPQYGMTFDLGIHEGQFRDVLRLVEACPDTQFVIDHLGKPAIRENRIDPWRAEMKALSECENVLCKVSSLATEADHQHWTLDEVQPYADWVFECFGFDRVMFGGDWPVSSQAASYDTCVKTLLTILNGESRENLEKFFRRNAERFYRI